ncbi:hypothetical protein D9M71_77050 [compost metagenome]
MTGLVSRAVSSTIHRTGCKLMAHRHGLIVQMARPAAPFALTPCDLVTLQSFGAEPRTTRQNIASLGGWAHTQYRC